MKEKKMQRKILIMGLPGAGKTTLATALAPLLNAVVFNADAVRANISRDLGFSHDDRVEHARRMGWMCDRVVEAGRTFARVQREVTGMWGVRTVCGARISRAVHGFVPRGVHVSVTDWATVPSPVNVRWPGGDDEPSLGAPIPLRPEGQRHWATSGNDGGADLEEECEDEGAQCEDQGADSGDYEP